MKIRKIHWIYFIILVVGFLLMGLAIFTIPKSIKYFVYENKLLENLTAVFYLISFIFAVASLILYKRLNKKLRPVLTIIALLSLICCLDEISWGLPMFDIESIRILTVRIDSAHDFVDVVEKLIISYTLITFIFAVFLLMCLTVFLKFNNGCYLKKFKAFFSKIFLAEYKIYFLLFLSFFLISSLIDLKLFDLFVLPEKSKWFAIEEYMEMSAGLLLVFSNVDILVKLERLNFLQSKN